jgi:hypothetical protein
MTLLEFAAYLRWQFERDIDRLAADLERERGAAIDRSALRAICLKEMTPEPRLMKLAEPARPGLTGGS